MKHISQIIVLAVALVTGLSTVSAQTVHVDVIQKVATLPSTATNYLEDPFRYFDVVAYAYGVGNEGLEVFCNIDFSLNDGTFYLRTNYKYTPQHKIVLHEGMNKLKKDDLLRQFRGHPDNNIDLTKPLRVQLLPEGTYQLCLDIYRWSDRLNPAAVPISDGNCPSYEICYSGSAPELVSPSAGGQVAMNGTVVVAPDRRVNFFWTPVISNCSGNKSRFRYMLKVVKVVKGQNYQDAINYNPTVFSAEVRNGNYAVLDTLRDLKVQMEKGALYVAQVVAEKINTGRDIDAFIIANDGKSQPVPFYWEQAPDELWAYESDYDVEVDVEEPEEGEEEEGLEGLTQWSGGVEETSELETILEEMPELNLVPNPKRNYVMSDGYYTIPMTDDIEVGFTPTVHEALKQNVYTLALYENVDGDIDSITSREPLFAEEIGEVADRESVSRTLAGWGADLQQGGLYYMELSNDFTVGYWNYSIADTNFYVNDMLAEHIHDTVSRDFVEDELTMTDGFFFQWGDDPDAPAFVTPQWTAPVDRSGDDIYDPKNLMLPVSLPEVKKDGSFPVSWTPVQDVTPGDEVEYEINVYELKPGQTLEEAVSENPLLVSRTVTDANGIPESDSKFFKVFSTKKTYVMTLSTSVTGESDTDYHFENGNEALPVVFKIVK